MICDKCDIESEDDDVLDTQEWFNYRDVGGYGSIIGDGVEWSITLCQDCTVSVLGDFINYE